MMNVMRTPRKVDIDITNRCNLRCKYCYFFSSAGDTGQDLPTEEWLRFFDELGRCSVMSVCLAGGEPFIREDLPTLIDGIVRNRMRFSLLSNGTLITDERAALLVETRRCDHVQVSIDGSGPATHDASRGQGTFTKAIAGIQILRRHQVPITVRVTINRYNVNDLEEISRLLLEEVGLSSFSTNSAGYMGLCRQNAPDIQLTVAERSRAMQTLTNLIQKYNGRINAQAGPLAEARQWGKMEQARQEGLPAFPRGGYLRACGGVMDKMGVRADGIMVPCTQMNHIELGRINQDDVQDVWQTHPALKRLRERVAIPLSDFEFCRECVYIPYCTGNCPALAYTLAGDDNHPSPDACLKRFLEAGGQLPESE